MAEFEFAPGFSYPNEFNYTLPVQIPPGLRQVQLRQVNYSNIPSPTPAGTEIIVQIPQLDYSFLDPSTTSLRVQGFLTIQVAKPISTAPITTNASANINGEPDAPTGIASANAAYVGTDTDVTNLAGNYYTLANYPPLGALSFSPNAVLGKGWGMFRRYQVYMNGNQLTDDIEQIGIAHNYLQLLTTSRGFESTLLEQNNVGSGLAGTNYSFTFPTQPTYNTAYSYPLNNTGTNANTEISWTNGLTTDLTKSDVYSGFAQQTVMGMPTNYDSVNGVYSIPFEVSLPLMGLLGAHNDKMLPLFLGPIKIQLYTEELSTFIQGANVLAVSQATTLYNAGAPNRTTLGAVAVDPSIDLQRSSITYTQVEFVGNYVRTDGAAFQQILSALPIPGKVVLKTGSLTYSSATLGNGAQGVFDLLIASRRASTKFVLTLCTNSTLAGKTYGSVCPWLTNGTCVMINGVQYPQQGKDFLNKPRDSYRQTLVALNLAYSSLVRPSILPQNWLRMSTDVASPTDRLIPGDLSLVSPQMTFVNAATGATKNLVLENGSPYPLLCAISNGSTFIAYSGRFSNSLITTVPYWQNAVHTSASATIEEAVVPRANDWSVCGAPLTHSYLQNQWVDITDTEVFGRRQFLSGQSTLSGSFFYHANIQRPIANVQHLMMFFCYFDAITIMDVTTKQIVWKI